MSELQKKSVWWSITGFEEEIALCEGPLPEFVKRIYGGRETCPKSGKLHFQGAIQCYNQIRGSKIKSWLPKAHFEAAKSADALKKYVMKEETSAGEKVVRDNPIPHYRAHEICLLLAQTSRQTDIGFWPRSRIILSETPELAGQLMNPSLRGFYEKTAEVWAAIVLQQPRGPQGPDAPARSWGSTVGRFTRTCMCGKDECMVCYEEETAAISINEGIILEQVCHETSEEGT